MTGNIELEIVTSTGTSEKVKIIDLYIPAYHGQAGILHNHLPYISILISGEISYKDVDGKEHYLYIDDGFLETSHNRIVILSDSVTKGENIDADAVEGELKEVEDKIKSSLKGEITADQLEEELLRKKQLVTQLGIVNKISG